jgi:exopolyphosphatase / guanosine-5'-triphosphate,3'-diphosphate pyrophosphatase
MPSARSERVAVIDLGSNSFRMVVFEADGGTWRRTDELSEAVRIGEGVADSGVLEETRMERAVRALETFAGVCEAYGLRDDEIDAVATSAIRDAKNGPELLERLRVRTGIAARVLSSEQEAHYGYLAAIDSTSLTDGCVLDLGGGSLQLVRVEDRAECESGSWRLGAVSMTERFLSEDAPADRKRLAQLGAHVESELARAPWLGNAAPHVVGLGGTVRNLASAAQRAAGSKGAGVHGFVLERAALEQLIDRLSELRPSQRGSLPGIKPARADIVLAGAVVVRSVLETCDAPSLQVTGASLREGILFERHLTHARAGIDEMREPFSVQAA